MKWIFVKTISIFDFVCSARFRQSRGRYFHFIVGCDILQRGTAVAHTVASALLVALVAFTCAKAQVNATSCTCTFALATDRPIFLIGQLAHACANVHNRLGRQSYVEQRTLCST